MKAKCYTTLKIALFIGVFSLITMQLNSEKSIKGIMVSAATDEDIPVSQIFTRKAPASNVIVTEGTASASDVSIIESLNEFDAVDDDDDKILTLSDDILFDFDSDELRSDVDEVIDKLKQIVDETDSNIEITGHTDSKGEDDYNQSLSEDRAGVVLDALVDAGVKKDRITSEGKGATEPVAKNTNSDGSDNPDGRQKNRRVEVTVKGFNAEQKRYEEVSH